MLLVPSEKEYFMFTCAHLLNFKYSATESFNVRFSGCVIIMPEVVMGENSEQIDFEKYSGEDEKVISKKRSSESKG